MSIDTIGDLLTIIRNGILASKPVVEVPYSKMRHQIAQILKREGFIDDIAVKDADSIVNKKLNIFLRYVDNESVIHEIKRVSKPSRRVYGGVRTLPKVIGGLGVAVVSTNKGIMTDQEARDRGVGGEVLCTVW